MLLDRGRQVSSVSSLWRQFGNLIHDRNQNDGERGLLLPVMIPYCRLVSWHQSGCLESPLWSKADMRSAKAYVRFTPESDNKCDKMECPLWAKSGHVQCNPQRTSRCTLRQCKYSIR